MSYPRTYEEEISPRDKHPRKRPHNDSYSNVGSSDDEDSFLNGPPPYRFTINPYPRQARKKRRVRPSDWSERLLSLLYESTPRPSLPAADIAAQQKNRTSQPTKSPHHSSHLILQDTARFALELCPSPVTMSPSPSVAREIQAQPSSSASRSPVAATSASPSGPSRLGRNDVNNRKRKRTTDQPTQAPDAARCQAKRLCANQASISNVAESGTPRVIRDGTQNASAAPIGLSSQNSDGIISASSTAQLEHSSPRQTIPTDEGNGLAEMFRNISKVAQDSIEALILASEKKEAGHAAQIRGMLSEIASVQEVSRLQDEELRKVRRSLETMTRRYESATASLNAHKMRLDELDEKADAIALPVLQLKERLARRDERMKQQDEHMIRQDRHRFQQDERIKALEDRLE